MSEPDETTLRATVEADLRAGGILSQTLPGYEERPAQIQMAQSVADALETGEHAVIEASTGTGKSLAYLLPIIRSGKVSLISTANKALQEQLFYKDIPFVQKFVKPFQAALVKGMGNYLCLDRLEEEIPFQRLAPNPAFAQMESLLDTSNKSNKSSWPAKSTHGETMPWNGDFELLDVALPGDIRGRIAADSDQCAWRSCPYYSDCYVRKMREQAENSEIIVVNHTLLLLDISMDGFLLPEREVIVIDEAHHLEEEATRAFTIVVTPSRIANLLAQRRLRENASQQVQEDVLHADTHVWTTLERLIHLDAKGRQPLQQPFEEGLRLAGALDVLASSLQFNRPDSLDGREEQLYDKLVKRSRNLAADVRTVFSYTQPDERVYYVERIVGGGRRSPSQLSVSAGPLDVSKLLREKLFDKISTIATSATLAVNNDFRFFRSHVGLDRAREEVLPLIFDYREKALLYVPRMRLEPAYGSANGPYLEELAGEMRKLVEASNGRAFLLFSSRMALDTVLGHLEQPLGEDYELIVQGRELGRLEMLRRFREMPRAVLLGLKSFWEGVDITGEALSLVAIDKLPFDPPDDPIHEARIARMKESGLNWFGEYVLPQAILRLKQGLGRLLRSQDDRGVMAILDKRLHTKSYGRQVLAALPPARRTSDINDIRRFFAEL
ncbi:MAG: ATP-dependent DNA helicase [Ktedonobacterales bacterium]